MYFRIYCYRGWPNQQWDGFRIAIFDYKAGVPGEIIWPANGEPQWVRPEIGYLAGWYDFSVEWIPSSYTFVAAWEQFYDLPDCDAASFDTGAWQSEHSWYKYDDDWAKVDGTNLMLRVRADIVGDVAPASLGRIKALYQ